MDMLETKKKLDLAKNRPVEVDLRALPDYMTIRRENIKKKKN